MKPNLSSPQHIQDALTAAISRPSGQLELAAVIGCVVVAAVAARALNRPRVSAPPPGEPMASLRRLAFPALGLLLITPAALFLRSRGIREGFMSVGFALLFAMAVIRTVVHVLRVTFSPSGWLAKFERIISAVIWLLFGLHMTGLLQDGIDAMSAVSFRLGGGTLNLWQLVNGSVVVAASVLVALWIAGLLESRLMGAGTLDQNLRVALSRLTRMLLSLVAVLIALAVVGIDLTTLSVFGGAIGVGVAFGLQRIASNYVAGFILLLERSIRIGNMVTVGTDRGQVTSITTRFTVLRSLNGVEAIVPNEMLVSGVVQNESYTDPKVRLAVPVQVGYRADVESAMAIMVRAARTQSRVLADPPPQAFVRGFADNGINLELGVWIADPEEGTLSVLSEINLAIWRDFKRAGIEIPFPQREIRLLGAGPT